jgi:hypothetical protein
MMSEVEGLLTFAWDRMPQIPRWSAERRAPYVTGRKASRKRLRAYVTRPPKGAAAPERLSALRSLARA